MNADHVRFQPNGIDAKKDHFLFGDNSNIKFISI